VVWLQHTANTYLVDHPPPKADSGWGATQKAGISND
jgi:hypothetical protein